jgi:hypothetical protein
MGGKAFFLVALLPLRSLCFPAPFPLFDWASTQHALPCKELNLQAIQEAVQLSGGTKKGYFIALRNLTGTQLTKTRYDDSFISMKTSAKRGMLFVGDSIMGEICLAYRRITKEVLVVRGSGKVKQNEASTAQSRCFSGSGFPPLASATQEIVTKLVNESKTGYDAVFVGGTTHNLLTAAAISSEDPLSEHRRLLREHFKVVEIANACIYHVYFQFHSASASN